MNIGKHSSSLDDAGNGADDARIAALLAGNAVLKKKSVGLERETARLTDENKNLTVQAAALATEKERLRGEIAGSKKKTAEILSRIQGLDRD